MWFLLFIKQLPVIAISEVKEIVPPRLRRGHAHPPEPEGDFEGVTPGAVALMQRNGRRLSELDAAVRRRSRNSSRRSLATSRCIRRRRATRSSTRCTRRRARCAGTRSSARSPAPDFGYWIAIWSSEYWPLVVGGKAISSWIPYTIFGFEVMVLVGAPVDGGRPVHHARIPRLTMTVGYDPRFSHGDFGVWVECAPESAAGAESAPAQDTGRWRCAVSARRDRGGRFGRCSLLLVGGRFLVHRLQAQPSVGTWEAVTRFARRRPAAIRSSVSATGTASRGSGVVRGAAGTIDSTVTARQPRAGTSGRWPTGASTSRSTAPSATATRARVTGRRRRTACRASTSDRHHQESHRRLHLGDDAERTRPDAAVQSNRGDGPLGRGELPARAAGQARAWRRRQVPSAMPGETGDKLRRGASTRGHWAARPARRTRPSRPAPLPHPAACATPVKTARPRFSAIMRPRADSGFCRPSKPMPRSLTDVSSLARRCRAAVFPSGARQGTTAPGRRFTSTGSSSRPSSSAGVMFVAVQRITTARWSRSIIRFLEGYVAFLPVAFVLLGSDLRRAERTCSRGRTRRSRPEKRI